MKVEWNRKYTTIAIYALSVIVASLLIAALIFNFPKVAAKVDEITAVLLPFTIAILVAVLINPLVSIVEKKLLNGIKKRSAKRKLAILITYVVVLALLAAGVWYVIPHVLESITVIYNTIPTYMDEIGGLVDIVVMLDIIYF